MIVGLAGHVDHGKSALVTALTGRPTDRLAEERRRGITIELAFAPLELPGGAVAGMVDVPGHEDFVRTMVAGASGIDVALLVVAADEGIMPQTEEHLTIVEHLGVAAGIPVITKSDLVEPEWLELVAADLAERLARSPVRWEKPIATSAVTGAGLDRLKSALAAAAERVTPREADDLFRLPIDRAFSRAGVGTVVTGTAWSGTVAVGDAVVVLPGGERGRVRSIETHGVARERSQAGARTAVGIAGLERAAVRRGDVLVADGTPWTPSRSLDVWLALDQGAPRPLVARSRVRVLLGTAEVMARVHPVAPIEPGGAGLARLRLESPVISRGGDRLIIRSYSPVTTIGGGRVLDPLPPRAVRWPEGLTDPQPVSRLRALVARRRGIVADSLPPLLLGLPPAAAAKTVAMARDLRRVPGHLVEADLLAQAEQRLLRAVREHHRTRPASPGLPLELARAAARAPAGATDAVLDAVVKRGALRVESGVAAIPGFRPSVPGGDAEIDRIVELIEEAGLAPPSVAELERLTGRQDLPALLRLAALRGLVEPVQRDRYYGRRALARFVAALEEVGPGIEIVPAEIRERLGMTRKYLIPLLEWADARGITVRHGDRRTLRRAPATPST